MKGVLVQGLVMLSRLIPFNPYTAGWLIWPIQNDAKTSKITETLANGYSSESTRQELSNEYQHDKV